jgi:hypothetical protein
MFDLGIFDFCNASHNEATLWSTKHVAGLPIPEGGFKPGSPVKSFGYQCRFNGDMKAGSSTFIGSIELHAVALSQEFLDNVRDSTENK